MESVLDSDNVTKFVLNFRKDDHTILGSVKLILPEVSSVHDNGRNSKCVYLGLTIIALVDISMCQKIFFRSYR